MLLFNSHLYLATKWRTEGERPHLPPHLPDPNVVVFNDDLKSSPKCGPVVKCKQCKLNIC